MRPLNDRPYESERLLELGFEQLDRIARFCWRQSEDHPAAYFVVQRVCERFRDEYDDQAVPVDRYNQVNALKPLVIAVLEDPENLVPLNALVRAVREI